MAAPAPPAPAAHEHQLALDRSLLHPSFSSWRLSDRLAARRSAFELGDPVHVAESAATDYLHTRRSVLHNHLACSQGRVFVFLRRGGPDGGGTVALTEVRARGSGDVELASVAGK